MAICLFHRNGRMENWNVRILGIKAEVNHYNCKKLLQTHYSITALFHYSNWGKAPKFYSSFFFSGGFSIWGTRCGGDTFRTASYSGGQATMHSPHFTQSSWSTPFFRLLVVNTASTGQQVAQASHPRAHRSKSK